MTTELYKDDQLLLTLIPGEIVDAQTLEQLFFEKNLPLCLVELNDILVVLDLSEKNATRDDFGRLLTFKNGISFVHAPLDGSIFTLFGETVGLPEGTKLCRWIDFTSYTSSELWKMLKLEEVTSKLFNIQ
jgi:hypothetical protein